MPRRKKRSRSPYDNYGDYDDYDDYDEYYEYDDYDEEYDEEYDEIYSPLDKYRNHSFMVNSLNQLFETFPEAVFPFLFEKSLIENLKHSNISLYFNVPHLTFDHSWNLRFNFVPNPMLKAINALEVDVSRGTSIRRLWSLDYPFAGTNNASNGCGVSIFAVGKPEDIFELMKVDCQMIQYKRYYLV
jgi:hypothetical protein